VTPAGRTAFASAHRVIDRVHRDAAVVRAPAEPARAPRLAERDVRVVDIRDLPDRGAALEVNHADLAGGQAELRVVAVLRHERRRRAGGAHELAALALLHLDVVDRRAERDVRRGHRVAGLDVGVAARDDLVAHLQAVGREDVALLAVRVVEERDARRAVRVVLDRRHRRRHADLVALPVDDSVALLVTTAAEAAGDAPVVVTAAGARLVLEEAAIGLRPFVSSLKVGDRVEAPSRTSACKTLIPMTLAQLRPPGTSERSRSCRPP
jgi:hypothetical protein